MQTAGTVCAVHPGRARSSRPALFSLQAVEGATSASCEDLGVRCVQTSRGERAIAHCESAHVDGLERGVEAKSGALPGESLLVLPVESGH